MFYRHQIIDSALIFIAQGIYSLKIVYNNKSSKLYKQTLYYNYIMIIVNITLKAKYCDVNQ